MSKEELLEFLQEELKINTEMEKIYSSNGYDTKSVLKISLLLNDKEIDCSYIEKSDIENLSNWNFF